MVQVLQSYTRVAALIQPSVEIALRILDAGRRLRERGLIRNVAISTHHRPLVSSLSANLDIGIVHLRYNAVHTGAEREVFRQIARNGNRPGVVAFTATSWRQLLDPTRVAPGERVPTATDCYRFVLSNPAVDVCLTGPASEAQAGEAPRAIELGPMSAKELAWMRRVGDFIHK